jgi:aldehyde:ferredoxin oxidoreductase
MLNDSYVGGSFAPELKFAGYDGVVVTGQSSEPLAVTIEDDSVQFVPAAELWGKRVSETETWLRTAFCPECKVLSIGPAGENRVPWACISTDQYHKAGRGGHGALMGAKRLKAIAVRGHGMVRVGDARAFLAELLRFQGEAVLTGDNLWLTEEGTPFLVDPMNNAGVMPTRNWSQGSFELADRVNSDALRRLLVKRRSCYQCSMACRHVHFAGGVQSEGPEYETIALCGPNCGVSDVEALMKFNAECDDLGLDTISSGNVVALAMDLASRDIGEFSIGFGDARYVELPELIANREQVGAELALGARALAAKYGHQEFAMEVKNLELPGYDPRGSFGTALAYATSDRGGCHMRAYPAGPEILSGTMAPDSLEGKAAFCILQQNHKSAYYSGIWCANLTLGMEQILFMLGKVRGESVTEHDYLTLGERIWNLARLFNLREGVEPDAIPAMLLERAFAEGPSAGRRVGTRAFADSLQEYYRLRGWNELGVPNEDKLGELGVDVRLPNTIPAS